MKDKERISSMEQEYERLFKTLTPREAPAKLYGRTMHAVMQTRIASLRTKRIASFVIGAMSFVGVILTSTTLAQAAQASGFLSYVSLLFSDSSVVFSVGKIYLWTLMESIPTPQLIVSFALLAILIQSIRVLLQTGRTSVTLEKHTFRASVS